MIHDALPRWQSDNRALQVDEEVVQRARQMMKPLGRFQAKVVSQVADEAGAFYTRMR